MSHLDDEQLAAVAIGDSDPTALAHLQQCAVCADEVDQLQALMRRLESNDSPVALETPPEHVWDAIRAQVDSDQPAVVDGPDTGADELGARRARKAPTWGLLAAAAAGVVVGGVGVGLAVSGGTDDAAQVTASAELTDLSTEAPAGDAVLHTRADGTQVLVIDAQTPEFDDAYLEVWLIDESIEGMVSLGHLTAGSGEFDIPDGFDVSGFPIVDISVEPYDGVPTHSGDSVTRGVLDV